MSGLDDKTLTELKKLASKHGVKGRSKMKRAQLVKALEPIYGETEPEPDRVPATADRPPEEAPLVDRVAELEQNFAALSSKVEAINRRTSGSQI